jgi:hypothetical protein
MSRNFLIAFGVGLAVIALLVSGVLVMQRGSAINIEVKYLKVRTAPLDENSAVAAIDLRVTNPSDLLLEVRQVEAEMVDASGNTVKGEVISEGDTKRVFEAVPLLGTKFLETLSMRQRLTAHSTHDYMVAVRFPVPVEKVDARHRLVLHVDEVDGKTFDFPER